MLDRRNILFAIIKNNAVTVIAAIAAVITMFFVRHGDAKPIAKKGLEALDIDD